MTTEGKIIGGFFILAGLGLSWFVVGKRTAREMDRVRARMAKNPALEANIFGKTYFPADQSAIASHLRQLLVPHLSLDLSRLHPDDQLVADLRMEDLDSMSTVEFVLSVEKGFAIKIPDAEIVKILTLRELTACIARLLAERTTS